MAKKNGTTELAMPPQSAIVQPPVATATAADFGGGLTVRGKSESRLNLSRLIVFQGTQEEENMYGQHKRGTFMDALEIRELGETLKIMPAFAFGQWSLWEEGAKRPTETWDNEKDVPREMLEWKKVGGKRVKPEVKESVNLICAVGGEPWPYLMIFKSTGLKAFNKTINPLEARRSSIGKPPGLYELGTVDDKNEAGQPFKRLTARPIGDASPELTALALKVYQAQQHFQTQAVKLATDEPAQGDESAVPAGLFDPSEV